jgi:pyrophosphatase PpaX
MIKTVAFDFDGTLADTNRLIINSFKHVYSVFWNKDCDEEYIMSTFGEPLIKTMTRDFGKYNIEDVLASYREYQVGRFKDEVTLYDKVPQTLEYLKNRGIKMGIVTSRLKKSTIESLTNFNIMQYFDSVVAAEDVENHKPNKEPLMKALSELGSSTEETLYVGDSKFDMECAINAEVIPVLVGWQTTSKDLADSYRIKHVLDNMWDITDIIKKYEQ